MTSSCGNNSILDCWMEIPCDGYLPFLDSQSRYRCSYSSSVLKTNMPSGYVSSTAYCRYHIHQSPMETVCHTWIGKLWSTKSVLLWRLCETWWRHQMETFSALLAICARNSPIPVNSPHKGQWRGAFMFSLICVWINGWGNDREAGDLRRNRAYYDVIVMVKISDICMLILLIAMR